ncbi:MAG: hypothetical protein ACRAVC_03175 [Trichormus sp.]
MFKINSQPILDFAESSVGGFPAVGTPLAISRETLSAVAHGGNPQDRTASPTQWLNFSRRILDFRF